MRPMSNSPGLGCDKPLRRVDALGEVDLAIDPDSKGEALVALDGFAQRELDKRANVSSVISFLGSSALGVVSLEDSISGIVEGAEVVASGRIAFLRLLVISVRRKGDAEVCLEINCLWVAHRILLEGTSRVERGDAFERRRASAALRSSIVLFIVSIIN